MKLKIAGRLAISGLLFVWSISSFACEHIKLGIPKKSDFMNCLSGYAIGYSYSLKSAEWIMYKLDKQLGEGVDRQDDFREDRNIPVKFRTTPADYDEPTYDMGHLANSESIDLTEQSNSETFLMSNMSPQLPGFNRAIWKGLENRERKYAIKRGTVYVMTGPILKSVSEYIGENKVPVPTAFWKLIYDLETNEIISFLIPHKKERTGNLNQYFVSVDEIERVTGLDLLNALSDEYEIPLEKFTASKQW